MMARKKYYKIELNIRMFRECQRKTDELMEQIKNKPGAIFNTEREWSDRYYGYLGEHIFEQFLIEYNIEYQKDEAIGESDQYDFLINGKKIDVKTAVNSVNFLQNPNFAFLINDRQIDNGHADIYVQIVIHSGIATITGWKTQQEAKTYDIKENTHSRAYTIPLEDLNNIYDLLDNLQ